MTDQHSKKSRRLGVGRVVTRRDFIDGIAVTAAMAAAPRVVTAGELERTVTAPQDRTNYNPPALTGIRGSHSGSFEAAHALRDGTPQKPSQDRSIRARITT
jgi:spermidine dehydrogenase